MGGRGELRSDCERVCASAGHRCFGTRGIAAQRCAAGTGHRGPGECAGLQHPQTERRGGGLLLLVARHERHVVLDQEMGHAERDRHVDRVEGSEALLLDQVHGSGQYVLGLEAQQRDGPAGAAVRIEGGEDRGRLPDPAGAGGSRGRSPAPDE